MPRIALLAVPLALTACGGGGGGGTKSTVHAAPSKPRPAPQLLSPAPGKVIAAQAYGHQLRAVVRLSGSAAAGQQLALHGDCGGQNCDGITFADSTGRWHTKLVLLSPAGRRDVRVRLAYADLRSGEQPVTVTVALRRAGLPQAAPQAKPPRNLPPASGGTTTRGLSPYAGTRDVIVIGDSLAVGMAAPLKAYLKGWPVSVDGRIGRPLAEGMQILSQTTLPPGAAGVHAVLAFSLFTNDSPDQVSALEQAVRYSLSRLGAHGCAIWATIARPPLNGISYDAANAKLKAMANDPALASRLLLVPWKEAVTAHPGWLGSDGVHSTPAGYAARAQMYAAAARACAA